jgi:hypothetical protein
MDREVRGLGGRVRLFAERCVNVGQSSASPSAASVLRTEN